MRDDIIPVGDPHAAGTAHNDQGAAPGGATQAGSLPEADEATFLAVLGEARRALEEHRVPAVLIGGIASAALGRDRWTHDIDFLVKWDDRLRALEALAAAGFRTEETDPDWLFKGFKDQVLVDVIFCASGAVVLDDEMLARAPLCPFAGQELRVLPPEDLLVTKALEFKECTPCHWFDALGLLASCELDWGYLLRRATGHEHRMLSLFLYARGEGLPVPDAILLALADRIMAPAAHDEYAVGRLQEALAQDPRTNELGIDAVLSEGSVVLSGTVATPDRREAVLAVARKILGGRPLREEITIAEVAAPQPAEDLGLAPAAAEGEDLGEAVAPAAAEGGDLE